MKKEILILGIIFLFIGVGIQPAFAVEPVKTPNIYNQDIEPKEYLFQTIIDIANNPDVKDLLEQYEDDLLRVDIDKSLYREIFFRNPRLLFDMLFTKPSFTPEYLDSIYDKGCQITNIIREDKVYDITKSITIGNIDFFDNINDIIVNNEELYFRIITLENMNEEPKSNPTFWSFPIICALLLILVIPLVILGFLFYKSSMFFSELYEKYGNEKFLEMATRLFLPIEIIAVILVFLIILDSTFDCGWYKPSQ